MTLDENLAKATAQVLKKLNDWGIGTIKMLPNMFVALIVMIIVIIVSVPIARLVYRAVLRVSKYRHIARLISNIVRVVVIALGGILALDALNLDRAVASMLAGLGIASIAVGFAAKDLFADYISGIILHFEHPFRLGDRIQTLQKRGTPAGWKDEEILGYVESIRWRATTIRGRRGERYTIPNKDLLGNPIVNYYITGDRRIDLYIGISYTPELQKVEKLALDAVKSLDSPLRDSEREVEFFYEEIKDTTVNFRIRFWTRDTDQMVFLKAKSEALKAINAAFNSEGIDRPSVNLTLDFASGKSSLQRQIEDLTQALASLEEKPAGQKKKD